MLHIRPGFCRFLAQEEATKEENFEGNPHRRLRTSKEGGRRYQKILQHHQRKPKNSREQIIRLHNLQTFPHYLTFQP